MSTPIPASVRRFVQASAVQYKRELQSYLAKRVPAGDITDLAQEVWIRLCTRVKRPKKIKKPLQYVYRVAASVVADYYAKQARRPVESADDCPESSSEAPPGQMSGLLLDGLMARQAFEWILKKLKPRYREILVLRQFCDLSYASIGAILEFTPKTTEQYYFEALAEAQVLLERFENGDRGSPSEEASK